MATGNGAQYGCAGKPLKKIEFVISAACRGAIKTVSAGALLPSYQLQAWPGVTPPYFAPGTELLVAKLTGLTATTVTVTLDPANKACNTAEKFLFNGELWWAAYSDNTAGRVDGCCGTA